MVKGGGGTTHGTGRVLGLVGRLLEDRTIISSCHFFQAVLAGRVAIEAGGDAMPGWVVEAAILVETVLDGRVPVLGRGLQWVLGESGSGTGLSLVCGQHSLPSIHFCSVCR